LLQFVYIASMWFPNHPQSLHTHSMRVFRSALGIWWCSWRGWTFPFHAMSAFGHVQQQRDSRPLHSGVANHNGLRSMHPLFSKHKRLLFLLRLKRPRTLSNYYVRTVNRKHLARKFINAVRDILAAPSHRDRQLGIAPRYEHLIALRYPEPPKQQRMRRS